MSDDEYVAVDAEVLGKLYISGSQRFDRKGRELLWWAAAWGALAVACGQADFLFDAAVWQWVTGGASLIFACGAGYLAFKGGMACGLSAIVSMLFPE